MREGLERCGEALRARGMQLSQPRLLLLELLSETGAHMTAEELYSRVREAAPGVSRTTVYNVLHAFIRKGIAHTVTIRGDQAMYELARERHAHFRCGACGAVEDVPMDVAPVMDMCPPGWEPQRAEVHFHGVCGACKSKGLA
ncbi:MAG TPA: Fur family transcriptional regulator [Candidatus Limnocylindria bacterium]|nr:Fur family transcriptional regulator [Candidatus Limnocylindria bacterium]